MFGFIKHLLRPRHDGSQPTPRAADGRFVQPGSSSGIRMRLDFSEANRLGVFEAWRVSHGLPHLAILLDAHAEEAFHGMQRAFSPMACASLSIDDALSMEWETLLVQPFEDPAALARHTATLGRVLLDREPVDTDRFALLRVAESALPIASTLAGRALLTLHPDSAQARILLDARLGPGATRADVDALIGCVFDPERLALHEVTRGEHIALVQTMITRGDAQMGAALTRAAIDAYGVDAVAEWRTNGAHRKLQHAQIERDTHIFACHFLSAFGGRSHTEGFERAYPSLEPLIQPDPTNATPFAKAMGALDDWSDKHVLHALTHPSHDGVYPYWASALPQVWSEALAARLKQVVTSGKLGPRGLTAILDAAARHDHVLLLEPARRAVDDLERGGISKEERRTLRQALQTLEGRIGHARHAVGGQLSLSADEDATGALSRSDQAQTGDLEALDD